MLRQCSTWIELSVHVEVNSTHMKDQSCEHELKRLLYRIRYNPLGTESHIKCTGSMSFLLYSAPLDENVVAVVARQSHRISTHIVHHTAVQL